MPETEFTLVTGASRGIGEAFARIAARNGRNVILSARSEGDLKDLAAELADSHGVETVIVPADLAEDDGADRLWTRASEGRRINFLVNNAGLGSHGPFLDADWGREKASIDVNVTALTRMCKLAVPHMKDAGGGRILNVASVAAFIPGPSMAVYHATKAYVLNLSVALNEELEEHKISVTALCPGATQSNFFNAAEMGDVSFVKSGKLPTAMSVAETGYGAAMGQRAIVTPGLQNNGVGLLSRLLPRTLLAKITRRAFGTM